MGLAASKGGKVTALAEECGGWSFPCDVSDAEAVEGLSRDFLAAAGRPPDILFVSAGVFSVERIQDTSPRGLARILAVNLAGSFLTVRTFLPALLERGSGVIIQVGSVAGRRGFAGNGAYAASKFGVRGMHEVLLAELRGTGVRATLLEPAATNTPIWDSVDRERNPDLPPRESMLDPCSVAACAVFVASRPAHVQVPYLTVEAA